MIILLASILFVAHLVVAGNRLIDLFTKSRRNNKISWMFFILLIPVIGVLVYNSTMQRRNF